MVPGPQDAFRIVAVDMPNGHTYIGRSKASEIKNRHVYRTLPIRDYTVRRTENIVLKGTTQFSYKDRAIDIYNADKEHLVKEPGEIELTGTMFHDLESLAK